MMHDAVLSASVSGRREFDTGERIEYACDDGFASSLGPVTPPFTTCSFAGFTADWDPIVGDCLRDGEPKEVHQRLHEAKYYDEDKRIEKLRAEREARQRQRQVGQRSVGVVGADGKDQYVVIRVLPLDEGPEAARQERIRNNVKSTVGQQERVFDPYGSAGPFFDEVDYNETKRKLKKEIHEKYGTPKIEPTKYDLGENNPAAEDEAGAIEDFNDASTAAAGDQPTANNAEGMNSDDPEGMPVTSKTSGAKSGTASMRKVEEDSIGPTVVLHQEASSKALARNNLTPVQPKLQQDSSGATHHYHSSQRDINRDIVLDQLLHHFMEDHPQVLNRFKFEELHDHVHRTAALEGDLALMEAGEDDEFDDEDDDDDYSDGPQASSDYYDYFGNEEGAFGYTTADCIRDGKCTPDGKPRWLSRGEGQTEAKKLAHLITMQKFNPVMEPKHPPREYKQERQTSLAERLSKLQVPCDGPDCQRGWTMEVPPKEAKPSTELELPDEDPQKKIKTIPQAFQHHKQMSKEGKKCKGDNCQLRPAWGLEAKGPAPAFEKGAQKPELVRLLWPGNAEVGKSPDYEAGEGPDGGPGNDSEGRSYGTMAESCWWIDFLKRPENLVKLFLGLVIAVYAFLFLRCFLRCRSGKGDKQKTDNCSGDTSAAGSAASGTATSTSGPSKSKYLDTTTEAYEDLTEPTNFAE